MFIERYRGRHCKPHRVRATVRKAAVIAFAVTTVHVPSADAATVDPPLVQVEQSTYLQELVRNVGVAHRDGLMQDALDRSKREFDRFNDRLAEDLAEIERKRREAEEARKKAEAERKAAEEAKKKAEAEVKRWVLPIAGYRITSEFGMRTHPITGVNKLHTGLDLAAGQGTKVRSVSSGKVIFAGMDGAYGNKIAIKHWDGTVTWYAHLSSINVDKGEHVTPGSPIGRVGSTGSSTGPHLHIEVRPDNGDPIDPYDWFSDRGVRF